MKPIEIADEWTRRSFLRNASLGGSAIFLTGYLGGCGGGASFTPPAGSPSSADGGERGPKDPSGDSTYFADFGINRRIINATLAAALSRGGLFADLFFQHTTTNYLGLQDGEVNRAYTDVELGVGVRVIKGDQTGFAFTEDLRESALLNAGWFKAYRLFDSLIVLDRQDPVGYRYSAVARQSEMVAQEERGRVASSRTVDAVSR